ncbi:mitochondrial potassium channel ATP-binding subunit isoform X1 [Artibeus jamaicensis]|uniref:mitochondrial potassium channel ATP-binding subunit isoform X1 n=1 Tax=Artibeus jamaicensis TaxID=9417 RepID=UPI00235A9C1A|nr:mitochondrial potassium channel ATP-binding subunit isoform X1 [Artibeus jamaicensis]
MLVHLFRVGIRGSSVPSRPLLPLSFQTFSAVRHSDVRHGSHLLRAAAQLRCQLRARLFRAPPAPRRSPSAWHWVGGALLGPVVLSKCPRLCLVALCEAEEAPPACPRPYVTESHFNWKLFWQFLRPHLLVLGAAILLALGAALVNVRIPLLLGQLVEIVAKYTRDHVGSFLHESRNLSTHLLILYGLQGLLTFGYLVLLSRIGERMAVDMRKALFSSLLQQDIAFFDVKRTGQLVSRLTADVQEFKSSFKLVISQGLRSCTQVAGCLVSLSMLSPRLTLLLTVATPILMAVGTLMGSALRKLSRQCQEQVARATGVADEALSNVRTVRAFAMEQREEERYGAELEKSRHKAETLGRGIALFQGLSNIAFNCMVLGTLFIGGSLVAGQQLRGGDLMSFLVASQTVQSTRSDPPWGPHHPDRGCWRRSHPCLGASLCPAAGRPSQGPAPRALERSVLRQMVVRLLPPRRGCVFRRRSALPCDLSRPRSVLCIRLQAICVLSPGGSGAQRGRPGVRVHDPEPLHPAFRGLLRAQGAAVRVHHVPQRQLQLPRPPWLPGARGLQPHTAPWQDRGPGGPVGWRKDHRGFPAGALLRPHGRHSDPGRAGPAHPRPLLAPGPGHRLHQPGAGPLWNDNHGEHPFWEAGCLGRRGVCRCPGGQRACVHLPIP